MGPYLRNLECLALKKAQNTKSCNCFVITVKIQMIITEPFKDKTNNPEHPDSVSALKPGTTPMPCDSATMPKGSKTTPGAPTLTQDAQTYTLEALLGTDIKEKPQS